MQNQDQKQTGVISAWFEDRGFGFVRQVQGDNFSMYFLHITKIISGIPAKGSPCRFNIGTNDKGLIAVDVEIEHSGLEALRTTTSKVVAQNVEVITTGGGQ